MAQIHPAKSKAVAAEVGSGSGVTTRPGIGEIVRHAFPPPGGLPASGFGCISSCHRRVGLDGFILSALEYLARVYVGTKAAPFQLKSQQPGPAAGASNSCHSLLVTCSRRLKKRPLMKNVGAATWLPPQHPMYSASTTRDKLIRWAWNRARSLRLQAACYDGHR